MGSSTVVRSVAILEAAKGMLVLVAGFGVLALLHRDVHAIAARLIEHAHLNPAARYPRIFLDAADALDDRRVLLYAGGAAFYAGIRLVEAYGLWKERAWAEGLAAISGGVYVPFEIAGILREPSWLGAALLLVNLLVVAAMLDAVRRRRAG